MLLALRERLGRRAYSQEGEDLVLARYFYGVTNGFFVDVGAHHPFRFSNTYLLYRLGWRGVNIDAMPGSMRPFKRYRPRDVNLEMGVGSVPGSATYYTFNEPALNTFDAALAKQRCAPPYYLTGEITLPVRPLADILSDAVPAGQSIDVLTVDVEGRDLDVLKSNDWTRFRPTMVLAETLGRSLLDLHSEPVAAYLSSLGYAIAAKTLNTAFLLDRTSGMAAPKT
jgi:FkbM family methyltransferase